MAAGGSRYILTVGCPDVIGIVASVTRVLAENEGFILDSQQYSDDETGRFFLRIVFSSPRPLSSLQDELRPVALSFRMDWSIADAADRPRVVIAVSKFGHCLNDLLHRWRTGALPIDVAAVISNHEDMRALTDWHGIPYLHLPVTAETKAQQEREFLNVVEGVGADLVVLARYMQVLSPDMCAALLWRCINIHHSFLPSFKGAKPYHQAHKRGVKLIGATAHYVTTDLDEGPIIEQGVERVDHSVSPNQLVDIGRDIEAVVLARAVHWHAERRVLPNGSKTVVFR